jgi:hypothetical protein
MSERDSAIYLIVEFNWPHKVTKEMGQKAKLLHELTQKSDWIEEALAGSGGVGGKQSSLWVFEVANYAALDRLLGDRKDALSQAFSGFFLDMEDVQDKIREKVLFS